MRAWSNKAMTVADERPGAFGEGVTGQPHSPRTGSKGLVERGMFILIRRSRYQQYFLKVLGSIVSADDRLTGKSSPPVYTGFRKLLTIT